MNQQASIPYHRVDCQRPHSNHHLSGFTLLEVMVAMAILAIALTTIYSSQSLTMSVAGVNDFVMTSAHLGSRQMAEIIGSEEQQIKVAGVFEEPYEGYSWQIEFNHYRGDVELVPDYLRGALQRIDLKIIDERRQQSVTITRYRWNPATE